MKNSEFSNHHLNQPAITTKHISNLNVRQTDRFETREPLPPKKPKGRRVLKWIVAIVAVLFLGFGVFVAVRGAGLLDKIFIGQNKNVFQRLGDIISGQTGGSKLEGERDGQVNILLLGIGGPGHDGPYLSDTIILAQLRPGEKKANLISIPRDYLVNTKEIGQRKINAVFAESYQKNQDWDKAGASARDVVSKISGLEIPYFAVVDFDGFEKTIDLLGGVDVQVDRTFTDYTFPDRNEGYLPAVTFKEGHETMNGERALIFARSRHAAGEEGTDFARSLRQQKIIHAAKEKVVSLNIVADAGKINELFTIIGEHFHTNMSPGQMLRAYNLTKDFGEGQVTSMNLDPEGGIICPQTLEESGAFVLTVCPGKTSKDVQDYFKNSFSTGQLTAEKATVWLADSSTTGKLYKAAETELNNAGLTVYKVIYGGKPLSQTVVYSVNNKPSTAEYITKALDASPVTLPPPGIKIDSSKVDVIVILGSSD
jgi:polyisoprenyl-teichoic acid--peptidoglycan teichoic acid transferase